MSRLIYALSNKDISDTVLQTLEENRIGIEDFVTRTDKNLFLNNPWTRAFGKVESVLHKTNLLNEVYSMSYADLLFSVMKSFGIKGNEFRRLKKAGIRLRDLSDDVDERLFSAGFNEKEIIRIRNAHSDLNDWSNTATAKLDIVSHFIVGTLYKTQGTDRGTLKGIIENRVGKGLASMFDSVISLLKSRKVIDVVGDNIKFHTWSLAEILAFDFENKDIILERLNGETLEEVGTKRHVTRERIRQIQKKVLDHWPTLVEEVLYGNIFETFNFSKKEFMEFVLDSEITYEFLNIRMTRGLAPAVEYVLKSGTLEVSQKKQYLYDHGYYMSYDGTLRPLTKINIFNETLFKHRDKTYTEDSFEPDFTEMVNSLGAEDANEADASLRGLIERSDVIIRSKGHKFRYYNFDLSIDYIHDLNELLEIPDGLYSIEYFYDEAKDLMDELDIRSSDELANLYKKLGYGRFNRIKTIIRQTVVVVGPYDKDELIGQRLSESVGMTMDQVADGYLEESNIPKRIILSYLKDSKFAKWYKGDLIVGQADSESLKELSISKEAIQAIQDNLFRFIFTFDEFKDIVQKTLPGATVSKELIGSLGYHMQGILVLSNKYSTIRAAYEDFILAGDYFDSKNTQFYTTPGYYSTLRNLENTWRIFKISGSKYITRKALQRVVPDVDKAVNEFIHEALEFMNDDEFYSYEKLERQGFNPKLYELGFEPIFYARILHTSNKLKKLSRTPELFTENSEFKTPTITIQEFLVHQFDNRNGLDIEDFAFEILEEFGLDLDVSEIKSKLLESGVHYSKDMNRLYSSEEDYLDEVYGNA
ncbi:hypothetical protein [Weissella cibaria]|uniref:hypothetical protein n=1 Tax=Weissella cibaria TaxID=137591 RepID=UPI003D36A52B